MINYFSEKELEEIAEGVAECLIGLGRLTEVLTNWMGSVSIGNLANLMGSVSIGNLVNYLNACCGSLNNLFTENKGMNPEGVRPSTTERKSEFRFGIS